MSTYFRWIARGPDLVQARMKVLQVSASPRTAYWVFDISGEWKPSTSVSDDRVLVAITFNEAGVRIIGNRARWIRFPIPARGEADHPTEIMVKTNEPGAYGIGRDVLRELNNGCVTATRLADLREMAKALGKPTAHAQARMRLQRWG